MKERPILFSGPMIKTILDGSKTQTRRIIKSRHDSGLFQVCRRVSDNQITNIESLDWDERNCEKDITCPYGQIGDVLWVRENLYWDTCGNEWCYEADNESVEVNPYTARILLSESAIIRGVIPCIHMPREACRIRLKITNVGVELLQGISQEDAKAEGVTISELLKENWPMHKGILKGSIPDTIEQLAFWNLWQDINGSESLESNPWVWVITFERVKKGNSHE